MTDQERIVELENKVAELEAELEDIRLRKDDVVDKLEKCTEFAIGLKFQRDEAVQTANQLIETLEQIKGAQKDNKIILPGNVDSAGNKKIII